MPDGSNQRVVQSGEVSQSNVDAGSLNGSSEPAATNTNGIQAGAVIAVLALIILVILADETSACSGSGCASSGTN